MSDIGVRTSARNSTAPVRAPGLVVCFLAAWFATAEAIGSRLPFPPVPELATRFRYFAERKDDFDTVFIGSSRVRYQIIPQQFDQKTAALGAATHSFNLGYSGMWPPESDYFLRQLLRLHPRHLRWVVIELMDYRFGEAERQPPTMRMAYWHDWKHTSMMWQVVLDSTLSLGEKASLLGTHARLFLERTVNLGRGAEWSQERYFPAKKKEDLRWTNRAGFDPEPSGGWSESARADFARQIETFTATPAHPPRPTFAASLQGLADEVRRAGAEPIFVLPPTVRLEENLGTGLPEGVTVWAFDRPAEYPRLYLPELHFDPGHLNESGAREYTSLLAQRLAELAGKR